jgi:NAD(P)-dependent dehydrogenase (short-subunit alcohol dehydrogenase family)
MATAMARRVAVVTGANRGLGLETCRQLARAGMRVMAASRNDAEGRAATEALRGAGLDVVHEVLDVADDASVRALGERLRARGEGLDVLVNNAGISMQGFDANVARRTTAVNFGGALRVTDVLGPAIRGHGRVVMVSSGLGEVSSLSSALQQRFLDPGLDRAALLALVEEFVRDVAEGQHSARGWPSSAYRVSKIAMNAATRILARELQPRGILVNAVSPGWVKTDMGGAGAPRSLEVGGRSIAWAALLPDGGPTGGFFEDGKPLPW